MFDEACHLTNHYISLSSYPIIIAHNVPEYLFSFQPKNLVKRISNQLIEIFREIAISRKKIFISRVLFGAPIQFFKKNSGLLCSILKLSTYVPNIGNYALE